MAPMGKKLTEAQIERYHRDGFVYPIDAFAAEEARRYRRAMEQFEAAQGTELTKGHNFKPHLLFTWVDEIVHHPAILDAVEDVIGPDIRLFHLSVWPKNAGDAAYVSWHQDATYFGLEPPLQVTAWVALTDASIEAGCMEVIPGSHKLGQLHHAEHSGATHNLLSRGQTITVEFDKSRREFMPVRAGQFSLHHTHLAHNSRPNLSADRRIGLGLSYIPTDVRCTSRTRLTAMLVRGTDRYGHFDDEPRPRIDFGAAERAVHADAVARFRASNAEQTSRYASAVR
jgi:ectoine hydroxylase-related dioxygenase (phytanoyl-CoA dioxygenase family)